MDCGDPFASFLAKQGSTKALSSRASAEPEWREAGGSMPSLATMVGLEPPAEGAPAAHAGAEPAQARSVEAQLREDVLRVKRQLLEVALQEELQSGRLDAQSPGGAERLRRVHKATAFLGHPGLEAAVAAKAKAWPGVLEQSASAPALSGSRKDGQQRILPRLPATTRGKLERKETIPNPADAPLLRRWWRETRSWNLKLNSSAALVQREVPGRAGGCVILGDGKMPVFAGTHLLTMGYYYAVRVEAVDDVNFPLEGLRDLCLGIGVSKLPANDPRNRGFVYGYELPDAVLAGYGEQFVDERKWYTTSWSSKNLQVGDVVGVLVSLEGDLVIFVNGKQVLRVACSLASEASARRFLFPLVDLHGRVSAVSMLPNAMPPNVPLGARSKKAEKPVMSTKGAATAARRKLVSLEL